jgi:hypothetical protein
MDDLSTCVLNVTVCVCVCVCVCVVRKKFSVSRIFLIALSFKQESFEFCFCLFMLMIYCLRRWCLREWLMDRGKGIIMDLFWGCRGVGRCCPLLLQFIFSQPFYRYLFRKFYQITRVQFITASLCQDSERLVTAICQWNLPLFTIGSICLDKIIGYTLIIVQGDSKWLSEF